MDLSAPTNLAFYISAALFVLGLLGQFAGVAALAPNAMYLFIGSYVVLAAGCLLKGF